MIFDRMKKNAHFLFIVLDYFDNDGKSKQKKLSGREHNLETNLISITSGLKK